MSLTIAPMNRRDWAVACWTTAGFLLVLVAVMFASSPLVGFFTSWPALLLVAAVLAGGVGIVLWVTGDDDRAL